jgi:hypothetical protein
VDRCNSIFLDEKAALTNFYFSTARWEDENFLDEIPAFSNLYFSSDGKMTIRDDENTFSNIYVNTWVGR